MSAFASQMHSPQVRSLQVWNALRRPAIHHPLFRRVSQNRHYGLQRRTARGWQVALAILCIVVCYVSLRYFAQLIFVAIVFIPLGVAGVYMALHGTIAGLHWAIRISGAIAREREHGMFDLLSTSPYGAFSASWAICTGCQYYDQTFNGVGAQRVWFSRIFFLTLLLMSAVISLADRSTFAGFIGVAELVAVLALAFYVDDIQSTVIGSLVGLIVPLFARNRLDARVGAFAGFLLLQIFAYTTVIVVGFRLLPQIIANLPLDGLPGDLALPATQFLIFFGVRECVARLLWWVTSLLFHGDISDLRLLSKGGRLIC